MTPAQYRMARAALGWTARQVANSAEMPTGTSTSLLRGDQFTAALAAKIRRAFEAEGIIFLPDDGHGPGVRFKEIGKPKPAGDHPQPTGPATDAVERMEADIAADRGKRKP